MMINLNMYYKDLYLQTKNNKDTSIFGIFL